MIGGSKVLLELFSFVAQKLCVRCRSKFGLKDERLYRVRGLKGYLGPWERKTEAEGKEEGEVMPKASLLLPSHKVCCDSW